MQRRQKKRGRRAKEATVVVCVVVLGIVGAEAKGPLGVAKA
jgi:hypothetical protein